MAPDIAAVTDLIREGKIWRLVKPHIDRATELSTLDMNIDSPTSFTASLHEGTSNGHHGHPKRKRKMY